jgi:hypothetical protein
MASNLFLVSVETLTAFAATYWLHSTLLLGAAWLLLRAAKPDSHFVRERVWKVAATAGFVTATVQLATGLGFSLLTEPDSPASEPAAPLVTRRGCDFFRSTWREQTLGEICRALVVGVEKFTRRRRLAVKQVRVKRPQRQQIEWRDASLDQLIPRDHRVRAVWAYVDSLDLEPLYQKIQAVEGGVGRDATRSIRKF